MSYEDSQTVWEEAMAEKVLRLTRDELTTELPYLSGAFSALTYHLIGWPVFFAILTKARTMLVCCQSRRQ